MAVWDAKNTVWGMARWRYGTMVRCRGHTILLVTVCTWYGINGGMVREKHSAWYGIKGGMVVVIVVVVVVIVVVAVVAVVVFTLPHRHNTMQSAVAGRAPIALK